MNNNLRKTKTYISLQVLYTFLASLLMVYHATQHYNSYGNQDLFWNFFKFGEMGEDLLFVLMGFTIFYTSYHFIEKSKGYKEYMVHTVSRIFLVYWVLIAIPGVIVWFINPDIHPSIANIKSDEIWQTLTMWFGHPRIAIITWVLTQLVFFAIVFGLAIISKKFIYLWYLILSFSIINLIDRVTIGSQPFGSDVWYRVFSPHNIEFAYGALAYFLLKKGFLVKNYKLFLVFSIIVFFAVGLIHAQGVYNLYDSRILNFGLAALLITVATINYSQFISKAPNNIFVKLGEAEYIILLIHGPILSIINSRIAINYSFGWIITLVTIFMILTVSYFIRIKLEAPTLEFIHKYFIK